MAAVLEVSPETLFLLLGVSDYVTFTTALTTPVLFSPSRHDYTATWPRQYLHQDDDRVNALLVKERRLYYIMVLKISIFLFIRPVFYFCMDNFLFCLFSFRTLLKAVTTSLVVYAPADG